MPDGEQPGEKESKSEPTPPHPTSAPVESKPSSFFQKLRAKASSVARGATATMRGKEGEKRYQAQAQRNKPLEDWKKQREETKKIIELQKRQTEADKLREKVREQSEKIKSKATMVKQKIEASGERAGTEFRKSSLYAGIQVGKQEAKERFKTAIYKGGREIGRAPYTVAEHAYGAAKGRVQAMRESVRTQQRTYPGWHAGLLWSPGSQRPTRGTGKIKYGGRPSGLGRQPRSAIPRGTIKPYWSKKLKKLARTNIRKFGLEDGMAKTKQVATDLGWKMQ